MKVKVEKGGPCRKTLVVELPVEEVEAEYRKICDEFVRVARIPGFRQGRAPLNLVESRFTREIWEEVKERLVGRTYPEAVKQAGLLPLKILDLNAEAAAKKPLVYRLTLDVPPEFKLPKYKSIPVTVKPVAVSDVDVQNAFQRFLERLATTEPFTGRPLRKGDLAQIDYVRQDAAPQAPAGKNQAAQKDPLAAGRNFWLAVGENHDFLPGFADALLDMSIGDQKEISLQLPADFKNRDLAGKAVVYRVQIKAARERKMPVLNDEFFKLAGVQSETDLRDKIRAALLEEGNRLEKQRQKDEIIDYLLNRTSLDLPESLVQEETRNMYASFARERLMRGSTREQLEAQTAELLTAARKSAGDRVKLGYILHKIGEEEKIALEETEVENAVRNIAQQHRMPIEELKKELEAKGEIDSLRHEIRMGKILDFLQTNAVAGEKGIMARLFKGPEQKQSV